MSIHKSYHKKILIFALLCSILMPSVIIPSAKSSNYFVKHTNVVGTFEAYNTWWIFEYIRFRAKMTVGGDLYYDTALQGYFLKNPLWWFPDLHVDLLYGYSFDGEYLECYVNEVGGRIYEIGQIIHGRILKGSSYRWVTITFKLLPGDGNGVGDFDITWGSGNINCYRRSRWYETSDGWDFIFTDPTIVAGAPDAPT